ncbi:hypothetical protein B0H10DRAFT_896310 [Mycena sp. CBHHK59/15]|nr:hypothetical protein B0H10DRAFT_896310 [Mycena sp. CBHHK59/15]
MTTKLKAKCFSARRSPSSSRPRTAAPTRAFSCIRGRTSRSRCAVRSLAVMDTLLRRDICAIDDPTQANCEDPDLPTRLPEQLRYAYRFWGAHLTGADQETDGLDGRVWCYCSSICCAGWRS